MEIKLNQFLVSSDKHLLQYDFIYEELGKTTWASTRPKSEINQSIEYSFCIGVYDASRQVAFARIVTDYTTIYYLAELVVTEAYRGKGIGKSILQAIQDSELFSSLVGVLGTEDAHGLYSQFGYTLNTTRMMIRKP